MPGYAPTLFLTLRRMQGSTNSAFQKSTAKFLRSLKRKIACEYLRVYEWRQQIQHAHVLLRVEGMGKDKVLKDDIQRSADAAGICVTVGSIDNLIGACRYIWKNVSDPRKKAELPPRRWRGTLFFASRKFLPKNFDKLWADVRAEWRR